MSPEARPGHGKGVLDPRRHRNKFTTARYTPSADLADAVSHFWEVHWSLPLGETFTQHTIPYPTVHIVFERERSEVVGPISGRFSRDIVGDGRVVGVHVRPGMFSAFSEPPLHKLVGERVPLETALPLSRREVQEAEDAVLSADGAKSAALFDELCCQWMPTTLPPQCLLARDLVDLVENDSSIARTDLLAARAGLSVRSLQRLFRNCVGLSPKFVIQRFRLLEASERLIAEPQSGVQIASALGFADQAHFIRAFKNLVGETPERYARQNREH